MSTKSLLIGVTVALGVAISSCSTFRLVNSEVYNNADFTNYHTFRIISPDSESLPPGMELVTYYNIAAAIREQMLERGFTEDPTSPIVINVGLTVSKKYMTEPARTMVPSPTPPILNVPKPVPAPAPKPSSPGGNGTPSTGSGGRGPIASEAVNRPASAPASHFFISTGIGSPAFAPYFMLPRSYYWGVNPNAHVVTGVYEEGVLTMDIVDISTKTALYSSSVATIMQSGAAQFRDLKGIAEAVKTLFSKFPVPVLPQYRNQK